MTTARRGAPPRLIPGGTPNNLRLIAAASPARLAVATGLATSGGPFTYRLAVSTDSGLRWSTAITGTTQIKSPSPGYAFLGFEDPRAGRWISDTRHIWTARDGALHWLRLALPKPRPAPRRMRSRF